MDDPLSLSHAAIDILWEDLALGAVPNPFEIRSVGATMDERAAIRRDVWGELASRGLARRGRLDTEVEDRLSVLVRFDSAIGVFGVLDDEEVLRARVSGNGRFAVLAVQGAEDVRIEVVEPHRLIASILGVLPAAKALAGRVVRVLDQDPGSSGFLSRVSAPTPDDDEAQRILGLKRERAGYFTAYGHDRRGRVVRSPELAWTDTVQGRFVSRSRTAGNGRQFTTHEPGSHAALVTALRELVRWVRTD
ncbi:MAG TPA: ESX secretion-associated protein EspG [Pseudonocardiaceae bacterium]|nr:ESX secretion-associated protein EspG [Pseudonocardiaceae bacterium]